MKQGFARLVLAAVVLNFLWFVGETAWLHGSALSGYQQEGQCFIGNHGSYREVECAVWQWNRLHGVSVFVTFPIALVGTVCYGLLSGARNPAAAALAAAVRASGSVLAAGNARGSADAQLSSGTLRVEVYPAGIVITGFFMAPVVIRTSAIRSLQIKPWYFGRRHIGIMCDSPAMMSSLTLYQSPESEIGRAIEQITGKRFEPPR